MALTLVPRSARALAEHLNLYYRTLKGIDRDSVAIRLPTGGSFEVRHSATNVPVLFVNDAGANLTIGNEDLADNSVTSAKIATGTIQGSDIAGNTITGDKIGLDQITLANMADNSVNSAKIVNGSIVGADIADNTIPSSKLITGAPITPGSITSTELAAHAVTQSAFVSIVPGAGLSTNSTNYAEFGGTGAANLTLNTTGGEVWEIITLSVSAAPAPCSVYLAISLDGAAAVGETVVNFNAAGFQQVLALIYRHPSAGLNTPVPPGTLSAAGHQFRPLWKVSSGASTASLYSLTHLVMEAKR